MPNPTVERELDTDLDLSAQEVTLWRSFMSKWEDCELEHEEGAAYADLFVLTFRWLAARQARRQSQ